ncbi:MAG: DUF1566 domain-containing protein [SAR324 cluster bacterium]|nr:DUF1566 domain-containing protein [SAR324 cluster bacterium]
MKNITGLILIFLIMTVGYGCEPEKETVVNTSQTEGTAPTLEVQTEPKLANIQVRINMDAELSSANFNAVGTVDQIMSVTVDVLDATDDTIITSSALNNVDGIWRSTLNELPFNVSLKFSAKAFNENGTVIFSSILTQTLVDGIDNNVSIALTSIDNGVQPNNPVIVSVTLPEKVLIDSNSQLITFKFDYAANLMYTIDVTAGKIATTFGGETVSSLSGEHNPAGDLEINFTAPSTPDVAELTVTIKDLNSSDTIGGSYFLNIVSYDTDSSADSGVTVVVGPAITDMAFTRSPTNLKVMVSTDLVSGLIYEWQGTGDFVDLNTTGNPIFITDFTDSMTGTLTVTVTDANNLQAFLTWTILAGDYPYTVNDYIVDIPEIYLFDEGTQLLWQDNTNKIKTEWSSANTYCQDLNLFNYVVWRLPTKNELLNIFARKEIFSNYYTDKYWTADEDSKDHEDSRDNEDSGADRKAFTVSFDDGITSSDTKTKDRLVRCVKN